MLLKRETLVKHFLSIFYRQVSRAQKVFADIFQWSANLKDPYLLKQIELKQSEAMDR